jgi:hypothetical protein
VSSHVLAPFIKNVSLSSGPSVVMPDPYALPNADSTHILQWYHVVMTFSDTSANLYLDGLPKHTRPKTAIVYSGGGVFLGYNPSENGGGFADIAVDDFRVYDSAEMTTEISAAMDAVLGNLIANNTMATTSTTMDNAAMMTITTSNEITVSNRFAVHTFNETTTSDDIAPVAAAMETITLEAEEI